MEEDNLIFDYSDFEKKQLLGKGSFGDVFLFENKKNGKKYALKTFKDVSSPDFQKKFSRELNIMLNMNYPSIVKFCGINYRDETKPDVFKPAILTEYIKNGSLKQTLDELKKKKYLEYWTPTCKYKALLGIAYGMRFLHRNKIIHRDLKTDNILLNDRYEPQICDFGISRFFSNEENIEMTKDVGTPLYMAPELLNDDINYTNAVDVYSFSLVAYEIITGKDLFKNVRNLTRYNLSKKILNGERPSLNEECITDNMKEMLAQCWKANYKERLTFEQICDQLSSDFSYIQGELNIPEIEEYISLLQRSDTIKQNEPFQKEDNQAYFSFLSAVISEVDNFTEKRYKNIIIFIFMEIIYIMHVN